MRVLVTGGAGFIGSNFVHLLMRESDWEVVIIDSLTYAGNLDNLLDFENDPRLRTVCADICNAETVAEVMAGCDYVVNFAAETHVDRSLMNPFPFIHTNTVGAATLLEHARQQGRLVKFIQISTDEIYGEVLTGASRETDPIAARNPYSASKVGGEAMARAYYESFQLPVIITRAGNNYGPYQYPEKLIPLFVTNAIDDQPLPLYGAGGQIRDRLYVEDHCRAILHLLQHGVPGEVYNIGAGNERTNLEVAEAICDLLGKPRALVKQVADRPGHDRRYCLDFGKLRALGWKPRIDFETGLARTVQWYRDHEWWWRKIKAGDFSHYYEQQYGERLARASAASAPQVRDVMAPPYVAQSSQPVTDLSELIDAMEAVRDRWEQPGGQRPASGFDITYDDYLMLTLPERMALSVMLHDEYRAWAAQQLASRQARWMVVVGGEVIRHGVTGADYPEPEWFEAMSQQYNHVAWPFSAEALIEEFAWSPLNEADAYPTIELQFPDGKSIRADLDTGSPHTFVDAEVIAEFVKERTVSPLDRKTHLGQQFYSFQITLPVRVATETGADLEGRVLVTGVVNWASGPFRRVNRNRVALVGRNVILDLELQVLLNGRDRTTRIMDP